MLKKFLVVIFFLFSFSECVQATPLSELGELLARIVTGQCRRRLKVSRAQLYFFMNTHWTKHLGREAFK